MATNLIDTAIFGHFFASDEVKAIFDERGVVESWLTFEKTLAKVQAEFEIIPKKVAEEICYKASLKYVSLKKISQYFQETRLPSISLVKALGDVCSGNAGEYIHYGVTSQDLYDTSLAIRLSQFSKLLIKELERVRDLLLTLAGKYKKTIMIGRTHGKHAIPTTFGFKMAEQAEAFNAHIERAQEIYPRIIVGSVSGSVGTFSSFRAISKVDPLELEKRVLEELGLRSPIISVQSNIERYCEFLNFLSLISVTAEKLAQDFFTLQRDEIAEIRESSTGSGDISSSTMPHKQNPKGCESIIGFSKLIRSYAHALMETPMKDERDRSPFWVEDIAIPQACILTATILKILEKVLESIEVFPEVMEKNLYLTKGLIMSENVMIAISKKTGRKQFAHKLVSECAAEAIRNGIPFEKVLVNRREIRKYLSAQEIKEALDHSKYLGLAEERVERVLDLYKR